MVIMLWCMERYKLQKTGLVIGREVRQTKKTRVDVFNGGPYQQRRVALGRSLLPIILDMDYCLLRQKSTLYQLTH